MAENKKSFVAYTDWENTFNMLSDEEAGKLIKHLLAYVNDKNPTDLQDRVLTIAFEPIKNQLKRDLKKYEKIREKRINAGKLGGKQKAENLANQANAKDVKQNLANQAVNVNDNVSVNVNGNVNDILLEKETKEYIGQNENFEEFDSLELEAEEKKEKSSAKKETKFSPPTFEEVQEYCFERSNEIDAQNFIDFYESKGWVVGKSKMKNWKAAVRTWEKNSINKNQNQNGQQQERFVGRQSIDTIQHNANVGYEAAERIRKQMLGHSD